MGVDKHRRESGKKKHLNPTKPALQFKKQQPPRGAVRHCVRRKKGGVESPAKKQGGNRKKNRLKLTGKKKKNWEFGVVSDPPSGLTSWFRSASHVSAASVADFLNPSSRFNASSVSMVGNRGGEVQEKGRRSSLEERIFGFQTRMRGREGRKKREGTRMFTHVQG